MRIWPAARPGPARFVVGSHEEANGWKSFGVGFGARASFKGPSKGPSFGVGFVPGPWSKKKLKSTQSRPDLSYNSWTQVHVGF